MADTWLDLLTSIDQELNRSNPGTPSDLYSLVVQFTKDRIRHYQRSFFWATPAQAIVSCVPGESGYPLPETIVSVKSIRILNGGTWQRMAQTSFDDLLLMDTNVPPTRSVPSLWAPWDSLIRIFQNPDRPYPMEWTGNGRIPIPSTDTTANFWTREAAELIRCATLAQLYLRRLKNLQQYQSYQLAADDYKNGLMSETIQRTTRGVVAINW